jgi:5'-phosphate synthase pdxT subunit
MKIGVLALQGAFIEHINILRELGVEAVEVRLPEDLEGLDGLIIPGGESTAIGKLADTFDLTEPLRDFAADNPVWGTCAGMIFMAKDIGRDQPLLGVMDIVVERNAFGRQVDSFITPLEVSAFEGGEAAPFPAVFIRGPRLVEAHGDAQVIARLADGTPVAAQQGQWLVTSFHPELSGDTRFHEYFVRLVEKGGK